MLNETAYALGANRSVIRELFEYGRSRGAIVGPENVYDYSLGNPSIPAPAQVNEIIRQVLEDTPSLELHGYTSAVGDQEARQAIADDLNARFQSDVRPQELFLGCGAAPELVAVLRALAVPEGEVLAIAPYFPEYKPFAECAGLAFKEVPPDIPGFQIDFVALKAMIGPGTQAVILNSPNNPSGVVYSEETLKHLAAILTAKSRQFGHPIYIISDEPYRELVYGGVTTPWVPHIYPNTVVCYSYSKSLSLPGERIGYVYVPQQAEDGERLYAAIAGAARAAGHVCAPSLWQKVIARCTQLRPDLESYDRNRRYLYEKLTAMGYEMAQPDGAFYLFIKAPGGDAAAFSQKAKEKDLLLVPGYGFGCPGYFRICYCVSFDMIERSLPVFEDLINRENANHRTRWYKDKVFYQIWPRSFKDGDGDGMGDLWGVLEKLDYIKSLGCDGIWFSPLYPSPGADCGYDISDYMDIAPEFGGMEAFKKVLEEAHARDMKIIMDLVVNHTSDEHEWFQKSRQRIDPYTDYYIWRPAGKKGKLPNNWDSNFEGKAWTYDEVRGEYYLHLFAVKQPDLNMDNPQVREEVKRILRFWLELGVDGFREDVITYISKKEGLPNDRIFPVYKGMRHYNHGPRVHEYLGEFRRDVLSHYDCVTLAEAPMVTPKIALQYIAEAPDSEMDMMIQFETQCADCFFSDYMPTKFKLKKLKKAFSAWQTKLAGKAWNMLYLENHDHPRIISRYGSEKFRAESGKMLAVSYLFQQGTPFIYQGQEIGMLNWRPESPELYEDVQTRWQYANTAKRKSAKKRLKRLWRSSRDSARTLVQWDDTAHGGFTTAEEPWFYVNPNYTEINVAAQQEDPDSLLNFYRQAIALRKKLSCVKTGDYVEYRKGSKKLYMYSRQNGYQRILVVCSFSKRPMRFRPPRNFPVDTARLELCNYENPDPKRLKPYETRVYLFR